MTNSKTVLLVPVPLAKTSSAPPVETTCNPLRVVRRTSLNIWVATKLPLAVAWSKPSAARR